MTAWPFRIYKYDGRWCIAVDGISGGPGVSTDPCEDDTTWPTRVAALRALNKWASDRGLTIERQAIGTATLVGRLVKADTP